ncbi:MAG: M20/M25/M40 family metallo-hydrolase [Candidatus Latescibacteria bacterium]|nr:M20/M25/M40 family metallo-hydrolase [Candidatus Latescibacterota bacterium]
MTEPVSCSQLLQAMVGFNTVNGHISGVSQPERPLAEYLEQVARGWGLATRRLDVGGAGFNLLVEHRVSAQAPWLLCESHLDTVSIEGMTIDPLGGGIEGGRLYGRGACDTKGTGAAMLWALRQYSEAGGANNIGVLFTLDEEIRKTGVRTFVEAQVAQLGWKPAGAIVGEPTRLRPVVAHNGVVRWAIQVEGRAAHSSDPSQGRSAISGMAAVIRALEESYIAGLTTHHALTGKAQGSINLIEGGSQINIIPELCSIQVDRRVVPGEEPEEVQPAVEAVLEQLRQQQPDLVVQQKEPSMLDYPLDPRGGEGLAAAVETVLVGLGLPGTGEGVGYGTDASTLARAGIPSLVIGPGDIAQAHTADEWIDLSELERGVEVYRALMGMGLG